MSGQPVGVSGRQSDIVSLTDDETVLGNVTFFWWNWWRELAFATLLFFSGVAVLASEQVGQLPGLGLIGLGLLVLVLVYRAKERSGCVVSDKRIVLSKAGLLSTRTEEVRMDDIRSIVTVQSGVQSILGTGSVKVDTGAGDISISVKNSGELAEVIRTEKNRRAAG